MSIKIELPSYLQPYTNNMEIIEVSGSTVGECLNHLVKQFAEMGKMLYDKDGRLFDYVVIFINGEEAYPEELVKPVKDGDELYVAYIIGGG
ncbi:MoaD/ThiS family protein [Chloroflexota bacterium]